MITVLGYECKNHLIKGTGIILENWTWLIRINSTQIWHPDFAGSPFPMDDGAFAGNLLGTGRQSPQSVPKYHDTKLSAQKKKNPTPLHHTHTHTHSGCMEISFIW